MGLFLLTCTYTLIGASVFYSIEGPNELDTKVEKLQQIHQRRRDFLDYMWNLSKNSHISEGLWKERGGEFLLNMSDELFVSFDRHYLTSVEVKNNTPTIVWTFSTAIFFAVTVVTTIGKIKTLTVTFLSQIKHLRYFLVRIYFIVFLFAAIQSCR